MKKLIGTPSGRRGACLVSLLFLSALALGACRAPLPPPSTSPSATPGAGVYSNSEYGLRLTYDARQFERMSKRVAPPARASERPDLEVGYGSIDEGPLPADSRTFFAISLSHEKPRSDESLRRLLRRRLVRYARSYARTTRSLPGGEVVRPLALTDVNGTPGYVAQKRLIVRGRLVRSLDVFLYWNDSWCLLQFHATEGTWEAYAPVFESVLQSVRTSSPAGTQ